MQQSSKEGRVPFYDEYGFFNLWTPRLIEIYQNKIIPQHENQNAVWESYISSFSNPLEINIQDKKFKKMVRRGIGMRFRPMIWSLILGVNSRIAANPGMYENIKKHFDTIDPKIQRVIDCDVDRTFIHHRCFLQSSTADSQIDLKPEDFKYNDLSKHLCFQFKKEEIRNVLCAFAVTHPDINYCQGLNFFAAIFIMFLGEETAFWCLCNLIEKYFPPDYFCNQLKDFQADLEMMQILINERTPELAKLAQDIHFEWTLMTSGWLLTLFTNSLPMATVLRIWDCFLLEGGKIIFRTGIAFLRKNHPILKMQQDKIKFCEVCYNLQKEMVDDDELMDLAFKLKAFSAKHVIELRNKAEKSISANESMTQTKSADFLQKIFGYLNI